VDDDAVLVLVLDPGGHLAVDDSLKDSLGHGEGVLSREGAKAQSRETFAAWRLCVS
jgi:hypothetical protein